MSRVPVLNGGSTSTEGSRITASSCCAGPTRILGTMVPCNPYPPTIQAPITPAESSRIASASSYCSSATAPSASGMVSARRVHDLLTRKTDNYKSYRSEGVRIQQQTQMFLASEVADPHGQFKSRIPPLAVCPPLPPPPGPPAPVCSLAKNQRLF